LGKKLSLSYSAAVILHAVSNGYRYGFDIMDVTGLPSGTVYPALRRMELSRLVRSQWEDEAAAQGEGRPARKYYEITTAGEESLAQALNRYRNMERLLPAPGHGTKSAPGRG
jgi:PadR family transcriptional regulator, regulatory protein PadR